MMKQGDKTDPDSSNEGDYLRTYTLKQLSSEKVIKVEEKVSKMKYTLPFGVMTSIGEPKKHYLLTVDKYGYLRSYLLNFDEVTTLVEPPTIKEPSQQPFRLGGQYYEREEFNWEDCKIKQIEKSEEEIERMGLKLTLEFKDEEEEERERGGHRGFV